MIFRFKMAAKVPILISRHFPKEFFNEIWLIIAYIYITEIKIGNLYSCEILGAKQFFPDPQNANLC